MAHSAAMMIGIGRDPLASAGTTEDSWEKVRLGLPDGLYWGCSKWDDNASAQ